MSLGSFAVLGLLGSQASLSVPLGSAFTQVGQGLIDFVCLSVLFFLFNFIRNGQEGVKCLAANSTSINKYYLLNALKF